MQDKLIIEGGRPLIGDVKLAGAKNSALKLLAASLLSADTIKLNNVPHLDDVKLMLELLVSLGVSLKLTDTSLELMAKDIIKTEVSYDLVRSMRASVVVLGPLLARFHEAKVALPGGCAIGTRPIDFHLNGLKQMGAEIKLYQGNIHTSAPNGLHGANINMPLVSVTATENLMMAATLAKGVTVINNAAREPEVQDLGNLLLAMGADISGLGTDSITIKGVEKLHGAEHNIIADRIEAGTYLAAGAMTKGMVTVHGIDHTIMSEVLRQFQLTGAKITFDKDSITLDMRNNMLRAVNIATAPYPGFPTDMQAPMLAMNCVSAGVGMLTENIFENRFMHIAELQRLGANIKVRGNMAISAGVENLIGAPVIASDLRASACLVLAGLAADGSTTIEGLQNMDRGYEFLEEKFNRLGANIKRVTA